MMNLPEKNGKRIYKKKSEEKIKRWTKDESQLYEEFVIDHFLLFNDNNIKRANKIFIQMSEFIKTKNSSQCRSHHQKFFNKIKEKIAKGSISYAASSTADNLSKYQENLNKDDKTSEHPKKFFCIHFSFYNFEKVLWWVL